MRRTFCWAVAALLSVAAVGVGLAGGDKLVLPGGGDPGQPKPLVAEKIDPRVAQLVADLGSDEYRTREKAGRDLAALGEKALPGMRSALLSTENPEVQRRLAVLVRKMDVERLVSPKRVTLAFKKKTIKETLDEIGKQTGYKIEYNGNTGDLRHDFEFEGTPFWVAVDKVATAAGCTVVADYDDEMVRVYNQESISPYVAYAGPFRFVATNIHSNKSVQLANISRRDGNNGRSEYMNLNFQIQSEPKNPMLGVTQAEVISATDDNGASLAPPKDPNNRSYYENRGSRGFNTYGSLNLNRTGAGSSATAIKSLKAKVGIILLSGTAPEIVVPDPLKVKTKTFVGRTVQLDFGTLTEDPGTKGQYILDVTVRKHGATEDENDGRNQDYNWSNSVWSKIDLFDAAGNRYQSFGPNSINNNGATVQFTLPFGPTERRTGKALKLGPPARLVVNEWLTVTHEVTFEFKDLPLP